MYAHPMKDGLDNDVLSPCSYTQHIYQLLQTVECNKEGRHDTVEYRPFERALVWGEYLEG